MRRHVVIASLLACSAIAAAVSAPAAVAGASTPVVTDVAPLKVAIGDTITIGGKGFVAGHLKNTIVFQRDGIQPVFVRADSATSTRITLVVPAKLGPFLAQRGGAASPTRFRLRVLARRLGKHFTAKDLSPTISPSTGGAGDSAGGSSGGAVSAPATGPAASPASVVDPRGPDGDCDGDGVLNKNDPDADNDLLSGTQEAKWHTDPCNADSDGDGVSDFFEVQSAIDLNSVANNPPTNLPAADPLKADANIDYDHDGLTLGQEYALWVRYGGGQEPLAYSDGNQNTGGPAAIPSGGSYLDLDGNGTLSDDERDADGDGLGNWMEINFLAYNWAHTSAAVHPDSTIRAPDYLNPDSDGDGIVDGADDQDHDGQSNVREISVLHSDPRDPCDPSHASGYCYLHG